MALDRHLNLIEEQAAAWLVEQDRGFAPARAREFAKWLNQDERHAATFAALAQTTPASSSTAQAASSGAPSTQRPGDNAGEWAIEFERTAKSNGAITFRVWPYDAAPIDVTVPVQQGDTQNHITVAFRDAFRKSLGSTDFRVNSMKNVISIASKRGERRFGLELVQMDADGVDISLGKQ